MNFWSRCDKKSADCTLHKPWCILTRTSTRTHFPWNRRAPEENRGRTPWCQLLEGGAQGSWRSAVHSFGRGHVCCESHGQLRELDRQKRKWQSGERRWKFRTSKLKIAKLQINNKNIKIEHRTWMGAIASTHQYSKVQKNRWPTSS